MARIQNDPTLKKTRGTV